jgi:hypothetical protein
VVSGCDARGWCMRPFTWTTLNLRAEPRSEAVENPSPVSDWCFFIGD